MAHACVRMPSPRAPHALVRCINGHINFRAKRIAISETRAVVRVVYSSYEPYMPVSRLRSAASRAALPSGLLPVGKVAAHRTPAASVVLTSQPASRRARPGWARMRPKTHAPVHDHPRPPGGIPPQEALRPQAC
eukprot:735943-Pleurochrysis_carterae.AAC.1